MLLAWAFGVLLLRACHPICAPGIAARRGVEVRGFARLHPCRVGTPDPAAVLAHLGPLLASPGRRRRRRRQSNARGETKGRDTPKDQLVHGKHPLFATGRHAAIVLSLHHKDTRKARQSLIRPGAYAKVIVGKCG